MLCITQILSCCLQIGSARKDSSFEKDLTLKHPSLSISPLKSKNVIVSPKLVSKAIRKDVKSSIDGAIPSHIREDIKSSIDGAITSHLVKVPLSFKTWSDSKILWDSLPTTVHDVGKVYIYAPLKILESILDSLPATS